MQPFKEELMRGISLGFILPLALCVTACSTTPEESSSSGLPQRLTGTQWSVERIDGNEPQGAPLTVDFSFDGRVNGNAGCNTFSGPFIQTGPRVRIGDVLSTRMACADIARQQQESRLLAILNGQMTLRQESDGQISLRSEAGSLLLEPRSGGTQGSTAARRATFNCDGTALTVVFAEETADIIWNAGTDTLAERPSESGVLYESQRNVLRGKGKDLVWTLEGRTPRHCVAMR